MHGSLVGVDLLPRPEGGWIVLEVNGAVEFSDDYSFGGDVFERVVAALAEGRGEESRVRSVVA